MAKHAHAISHMGSPGKRRQRACQSQVVSLARPCVRSSVGMYISSGSSSRSVCGCRLARSACGRVSSHHWLLFHSCVNHSCSSSVSCLHFAAWSGCRTCAGRLSATRL